MAETIKAAGTAPEQITGYWNTLKAWPGIYGDISFTPEQHNGFPDDEVIFCEVNSLRDGAFNLAPGYGS
jgi:branched-chain amino acid transport system substrate-binding protein